MALALSLVGMQQPPAKPSADGQRYPVPGGPLLHAATKTGASLGAYGLLRQLKVPKEIAVPVSTVGVWALAKGLEASKGHRLGKVDALHDLGWHSLGVLPLSLGGWKGAVTAGGLGAGLMATRSFSSPRW